MQKKSRKSHHRAADGRRGTGLSRDGTAEEAVPNSFEHCRWKAIFLAARSQIYLTLEATFLIVKIVLLQENGLAIAISN